MRGYLGSFVSPSKVERWIRLVRHRPESDCRRGSIGRRWTSLPVLVGSKMWLLPGGRLLKSPSITGTPFKGLTRAVWVSNRLIREFLPGALRVPSARMLLSCCSWCLGIRTSRNCAQLISILIPFASARRKWRARSRGSIICGCGSPTLATRAVRTAINRTLRAGWTALC